MAITDRDSARAWLETQEHPVRVAFAARCAVRAAPGLGFADPETLGGLALPVLRAMMSSGVAAVCPTPELKEDVTAAALSAASAALSARSAADPAADPAAYSAYSAADSAALSARSAADPAARSAAFSAYSADYSADSALSAASAAALSADYSAAARSAAFSACDWDTGHFGGNDIDTVFNNPLWPPDIRGLIPPGEPGGLFVGYAKLVDFFESDPQVWGFWHRWLDGMRTGQPMDWKLQEQIALIETEIWEAGPGAVAREIKLREDAFWADSLPQAEELVLSPDKRTFSVKANTFESTAALDGWLRQVEFAVSLAVQSNTSDFSPMCTAYKYIAHTLENCRDDPNAVEQQFGIARTIIDKNLSRPDYRSDDSLEALAQMLAQVQVQMRADHPEVRKAWEKRIAQRLRETDRETKLAAAQAIRAETERSNARLSQEMILDAETVEKTDVPEAQAAALSRAGGRAAKMNMIQRASDTVQDIDKSSGYKAIRIGQTGYVVGDIVWMLKDLIGLG